jgi:hypothetical protein
LLEVAQVEKLSPQLGRVLRVLSASHEATEMEIRTELACSHNLAWRLLRKLSVLGWIRKNDGRFILSERVGQINPYDPAHSVLMGKHGLRLIVVMKDFGVLSDKEMSALIGAPRATVQRLVKKLITAEVIVMSELGKMSLSTKLFAHVKPFDLWPLNRERERDALSRFIAYLVNLMSPIAIIFYGAPDLNIMVLYDGTNPKVGETIRQVAATALNNEKLAAKTLAVASRHAWLRELHRVHIPPSLTLRNALFGLAVYGEKPKHDLAYLYKAYDALSPISDDDRRAWLKKNWIVQTESGLEFTPTGLALNRKGPAKEIVQDIETISGINTVHIFA